MLDACINIVLKRNTNTMNNSRHEGAQHYARIAKTEAGRPLVLGQPGQDFLLRINTKWEEIAVNMSWKRTNQRTSNPSQEAPEAKQKIQ